MRSLVFVLCRVHVPLFNGRTHASVQVHVRHSFANSGQQPDKRLPDTARDDDVVSTTTAPTTTLWPATAVTCLTFARSPTSVKGVVRLLIHARVRVRCLLSRSFCVICNIVSSRRRQDPHHSAAHALSELTRQHCSNPPITTLVADTTTAVCGVALSTPPASL